MAKGKSLVRLELESNEYERKLKQASKSWNEFTRGIGLSMAKFTAAGVAIGGVTAALKIARDAFGASEKYIDEWGRTVEASKTLYEGFLNAVNTGDIGGFLSNMSRIVSAAREAYDALDYLYTMKTINAPGTSARQTEISRLQGMLRTGRATDSLAGGRNYAKEGELLSKEQRQAVANDLKALLQESRETIQSEVNAANDAIDALYEQHAKVLGMSSEEFREGTKNMTEFNKRLEMAQKYNEYRMENKANITFGGASFGAYSRDVPVNDANNPYASYKAWANFKDDGPMFKRIVEEIQKRDAATSQYYGLVSQSYRGINRAEGVSAYGGGGGKTTKKAAAVEPPPVDEWRTFTTQLERGVLLIEGLKDVNIQVGVKPDQIAQWEELYNSIEKPLSPLRQMQEEISRIQSAMLDAATPEEWQKLSAQLEQAKSNMAEFTSEAQPKKLIQIGENTQKAWAAASDAVASIGSALQGIEDPAAQVAGIIAKAIANIALGFAQAAASPATGAAGVFGWIAAATAGTATMVSTIAAIKSATAGSFATGGVVPGNSFSGDNQMIMANAGEVVLTKAMQGNLASQLTSRDTGGSSQTTINGDQIRIVLRNAARRRGVSVGEYLQF